MAPVEIAEPTPTAPAMEKAFFVAQDGQSPALEKDGLCVEQTVPIPGKPMETTEYHPARAKAVGQELPYASDADLECGPDDAKPANSDDGPSDEIPEADYIPKEEAPDFDGRACCPSFKSKSCNDGVSVSHVDAETKDNPDVVNRVVEKNRLRALNHDLENHHSGRGIDEETDANLVSDSKMSFLRPPKKAIKLNDMHLPSSVGDNEDTNAASQNVDMEEQDMPPESPASAGSAEAQSPQKTGLKGRAAPRLSPVPEDADAEEQKRIKAKNRLRTYRWNKAQGLLKKRLSTTGSDDQAGPGADHDDEPGKPHTKHTYSPTKPTSASAFSSFHHMDSSAIAAMVAAAASAQHAAPFPHMQHVYGQQPAVSKAMRGLNGNRNDASQSPQTRSPAQNKQRKPMRVPSGPPRLSPEPEDPKEAKRVRSKNRVRMHRYNQSRAAAARAEQEDSVLSAPSAFASLGGGRMPHSFPHAFFPPVFPGHFAPPSAYAAEFMHGDFRHAFDSRCGLAPPGLSQSDGAFAPPVSQSLPRTYSKRSASETGTDCSKLPPKKARRNTDTSIDPSYSFCAAVEELPFQDLPDNLRDLALETYIKETMGMASSLQSLEVQLRANQAVAGTEGGPIAQQSVALIAAVSQLRSDAWGLSQLRLSQYAAMSQASRVRSAEEPKYRTPANADEADKVAAA